MGERDLLQRDTGKEFVPESVAVGHNWTACPILLIGRDDYAKKFLSPSIILPFANNVMSTQVPDCSSCQFDVVD